MKDSSTRQSIAYFSAFFLLGAVISSLGPTIPGLASQVGVDTTNLGLLFSTRSFGYLFGSLLAGWMLDRMGGHAYLAIILILLGVFLFFVPTLPNLLLLGAVLFMIGVGLGSMDVSSNTLLAAVHDRESGPYLNAMYLAAGVGSFLTPLYLGYVSLSLAYITLSLIALPLILWILTTPSPRNSGQDDEQEASSLNINIILLFALLAFLFVGMEVSYGGWIFTYFLESGIGTESSAYTLTSIFWMAITVGRLVGIPISVHVKPVRTIFIYLIGGLLSTAIILILPTHSWSVWVGTAGIGLCLATLFPTTFNYIQRTNELNSRASGIVWSVGSTGGIIIPLLIDWGFDGFGPHSMMVIVLTAWTLTLIIFSFLRGANHDQIKRENIG